MPRRKKQEIEEVIEKAAPDNEDTQILNAADIEAEEADLLADEPAEAGNDKPEKEAAPEEEGTEIEAVAEEEVKPKRQRRSRKKAEPKIEATPEVTSGSDFAAKNMEEMVKQWNAIKEISNAIAQNFEKMNVVKTFQKSPDEYLETGEIFRPQVPKVPFITKFATGASLVATLLSVLSLSLSQSARNAVIGERLTSAARPSQNVSSLPTAPEIAHVPQPRTPLSPQRRKDTFFKVKK